MKYKSHYFIIFILIDSRYLISNRCWNRYVNCSPEECLLVTLFRIIVNLWWVVPSVSYQRSKTYETSDRVHLRVSESISLDQTKVLSRYSRHRRVYAKIIINFKNRKALTGSGIFFIIFTTSFVFDPCRSNDSWIRQLLTVRITFIFLLFFTPRELTLLRKKTTIIVDRVRRTRNTV